MSLTRRHFLGVCFSGALVATLRHHRLGTVDALQTTSVVFHGREDLPQICLTYDDLWDEAQSLAIGQAFADHDLSVTFFPSGNAITANIDNPTEGYDDLYPKLLDMGHEFGCHLYTHTDISDYDHRRLKWWEVEPWLDELARALGEPYEPVALRPPMGIVTDPLFDIAIEYDMRIVLWNADSRDVTCGEDCEDDLFNRFDEQLSNGAIYLYHTLAPSHAIIEKQLARLEEAEMQAVPLSEMLATLEIEPESTPEPAPNT